MANFSTRAAAKQLGVSAVTLSRYISAGKVPAPKMVTTGGITVHIWSERDITRLRKLLPKIQNIRMLNYQKQRKKPKK